MISPLPTALAFSDRFARDPELPVAGRDIHLVADLQRRAVDLPARRPQRGRDLLVGNRAALRPAAFRPHLRQGSRNLAVADPRQLVNSPRARPQQERPQKCQRCDKGPSSHHPVLLCLEGRGDGAGRYTEIRTKRCGVAADGTAQAGDMVAGCDLDQGRRRHLAVGHRIGAAGMEMAAGRRLGRARHVALHDPLAHAAPLGIGRGGGRQQRLGVGMQGLGEQGALGRELDDATEIHHRDAMADMAHHGEVVADEEIGEPVFLLQVDQQVQHLRLHRHVERRHRLIGHDQLGVDRQGLGDAQPLALAAGELVGVLAHGVGPQPDAFEQPRHAFVGFARRA